MTIGCVRTAGTRTRWRPRAPLCWLGPSRDLGVIPIGPPLGATPRVRRVHSRELLRAVADVGCLPGGYRYAARSVSGRAHRPGRHPEGCARARTPLPTRTGDAGPAVGGRTRRE